MISDSTIARYADLDPDVRLMLAVRNDDAAAFETLVHRYQGRLTAFLRHWLEDEIQLEDLVQDVFLRVYRARKTYQPGSRFSTWLYSIAQNVGRNARRSLARRHEVQLQQQTTESRELTTLEQMAKAASGLMPARQFAQREMSEVVSAALKKLNERQRMAILLCKFEGMSYDDIAEAMRISPAAVKSLLTRARENLRESLQEYLQDPPETSDWVRAQSPTDTL